MFLTLVRRDLTLALRRPGALALPVLFFIIAAALFPFAVGPDVRLLARIAPGVLWVAALLAALLPVETLVEPDRADGTLDQYVAREIHPFVVKRLPVANIRRGAARAANLDRAAIRRFRSR